MCEQCSAETETICEDLLPGWALVVATKDGDMMKAGDYGLIEINDPTFIISKDFKPVPDFTYDMSDEEFDNLSEDEYTRWVDISMVYRNIGLDLMCDPETGHRLVSDGAKAGYELNLPNRDLETYGSTDAMAGGIEFNYWLIHKMGLAIQEYEAKNAVVSV